MTKNMIVLSVTVIVCLALIIWAVLYDRSYKRKLRDTQRIITDLELLRLFERQPGGLLSAEMVAQKTELNKKEAWTRLHALAHGRILRTGVNPSGRKHYFELTAPLEQQPELQLSSEPFLTVEDLQAIFQAYDYAVSPQDMMVATGLPWEMLSKELQHFRKAGIIDVIAIDRPGDSPKQYVLAEAYHGADSLNLADRERLNEEVRQLLYDERLLV